MTLSFKNGATIYEKPICDVLQRWRRSLASLLFFIILLTENFGLSSCSMNFSKQYSTNQIFQDIFGINPDNTFISSRSQCLYIDRNTSRTMCSQKSRDREEQVRKARLKFCNFYSVFSLINGIKVKQKCIYGSAQECEQCFEELEHIDAGLHTLMCSFKEILSRYDCHQIHSSSTRYSCTDCLNAYKDWLCATNLRYYGDEDPRLDAIPPCRDYCTSVLSRCPYFLPALDDQYAGEPAFLCTSDHEHNKGTAHSGCYTPDLITGPHSRLPDSDIHRRPPLAPSDGAPTNFRSLYLSILLSSCTLLYQHHILGLT